jgi:osmotically-inducible protein OsmY
MEAQRRQRGRTYSTGQSGFGSSDDGAPRSSHAWYAGDPGHESWEWGDEQIARYEERYPQAHYRRGREDSGGEQWAPGRDVRDEDGRSGEGSPDREGYVQGYSRGYMDGYRAGQQSTSTMASAGASTQFEGGMQAGTVGNMQNMRAPGSAGGRGGMGGAAAMGRSTGMGHVNAPMRRTGPKGYQRSDEAIHEDVCVRLARDHSLDVSEVTVSVSGGNVTLSGTVPDRQDKYAIEEIADEVYGVNDVINNIRVNRPGMVAGG